MTRGAFIVLEGLDRSGKTTQCKRLVEHLKEAGVAIRYQPYPDRSEPTTGPQIDAFLKTATSPYEDAQKIHDLFAANRRTLDAKLRADVAAGVTVVADRYSFSGIAYTAAKEDAQFSLERACATEVGLLRPDVVVYLRADPSVTARRAGFGDEALERADFQRAVRGHMEALVNASFCQVGRIARAYANQRPPVLQIVDADGTKDEVFEALHAIVERVRGGALPLLASFVADDFNYVKRRMSRA